MDTYPLPARGVPDGTGPLVTHFHVGGTTASVTLFLWDFGFALVTVYLSVSNACPTSV